MIADTTYAALPRTFRASPRQEVEIEKLLQWAYRDELPKRHISSAEGIWNRIAEDGRRGGIDPGHGAAQRYPHFGLPHPDAEEIEKGVATLADVAIDWTSSLPAVMGDLAGLISINEVERKPSKPGRTTRSGWTNRKTGSRNQVENRPRDVIMVGSLHTAALVTMHAAMGTRPDWGDESPHPCPTPALRGPNAMLVGECWGKNLYSPGSHCPVQWEPSPLSIADARAEYIAWHHGLEMLAQQLCLAGHVALPPVASRAPWLCPDIPARIIYERSGKLLRVLPLGPQRTRAGPRKQRPRVGAVRTLLHSTGHL